jgi:hypothetical protein
MKPAWNSQQPVEKNSFVKQGAPAGWGARTSERQGELI